MKLTSRKYTNELLLPIGKENIDLLKKEFSKDEQSGWQLMCDLDEKKDLCIRSHMPMSFILDNVEVGKNSIVLYNRNQKSRNLILIASSIKK